MGGHRRYLMKKKIKLLWLFKFHRYGRTVGMITAWLLVIIFVSYFITKFFKYMAVQTLALACPSYPVCILVHRYRTLWTQAVIRTWPPLCVSGLGMKSPVAIAHASLRLRNRREPCCLCYVDLSRALSTSRTTRESNSELIALPSYFLF